MTAAAADFLAGGGRTGAMIRALDWTATPLGHIATWPQSLRTTVSTCLNCSFPILIWWGPELVKIYNDAYAEIIAEKHPFALGRPGRQVWPEIWETIGPMLDGVLQRGEAVPANDMMLVLQRRGYPEECYFSFSYSPIRDETGGVGGVFCPVIETTQRVFAERRSAFLLRLEAALRDLADPLAVKAAASELLGRHIGASQVGYADVVQDGTHVLIEGEWDDGRLANTCGLHRLDAYGPAMIADLRAGRIVRVDDVRRDPRTCDADVLAAYDRFGLKAFLEVPLIKGGSLTAVLFVHYGAARRWSEEEIACAVAVAERTWSAAERAAAEAARRRSEEAFRALGENLPNLCWMARADGWIYWFNRGWYDYTGRTEAELTGWGWQSVHHPALLPDVAARWADAIATGSRFEMTFPLRGADGAYRPFLTRIVPLRDANGTITQWFGTNVDISAQRDIEERLRRSEAELLRLNATLGQQVEARTAERDRMWRLSTDVMLVAGFDGRIVAANPAWTTMLGWTEAALQDLSFFDLVHPDDIAATARRAAELSEGQTVLRFENRYRHRDGSYRLLAWSAVPDAGLIHAVGRDITAEKAAAAKLEATQERLRQAQRMEALGQLAGGIAHDFNNVLQAVAGGLHLIRNRADDAATVQKIARMAAEAAARGASITGRLLSFARQGELQSVAVDPVLLLEGVTEMLTHTLGPGIAVRAEVAGGIPWLLADRAQLETVLVNLAVNARDAMPGGGILTISARADTAPNAGVLTPGDYVSIAVADTGTGMDAATLARAGLPFFTTKPPGRGTGLGLAMARGFCEQSGGGFAIASTLGEGTTVTLWLPQAGATAATAPGDDAAAPPEIPAATRLMLVDDDVMVRQMLAEHLADVGYRIIQAADGLDALARLDAGAAVDLLVTDFAMPGMNGLALIQEARRRVPSLPVVLLTGFADAQVRERVADDLSAGAVLLQKPVSPAELAARAAALLKRPAAAE